MKTILAVLPEHADAVGGTLSAIGWGAFLLLVAFTGLVVAIALVVIFILRRIKHGNMTTLMLLVHFGHSLLNGAKWLTRKKSRISFGKGKKPRIL